MLLKIAALVDFASHTPERKLNLLGIFDRILPMRVPYAHRNMTLVVRLTYEAEEAGEKRLRVALVNADHRNVFLIEGAASFPELPKGEYEGGQDIILGLQDVVFPEYGDYQFCCYIAETEVAAVPVRVLPPRA